MKRPTLKRLPPINYVGRLCPGDHLWPSDIEAFYESRKHRKVLPLWTWVMALEGLMRRRKNVSQSETFLEAAE